MCDPDETEGRKLYRQRADKLASVQMNVAERKARLVEPMALAEVAALFGVTKQTAANWVSRDKTFPKPITELAMGKIYDRKDIVQWGKEKGKL